MAISIYSREIEIFLKLCEFNSLKETAAYFGLSVSAVSRQIAFLEETLGMTLFDRTTRPMTLTANGRELAHELQPGLSRAREVIKNLRNRNAVHPSLRIGIVDSLTYSLAPLFMNRIQPEVSKITCLTGTSDSLLQRLADHEVDIVLVSSSVETIPNLRSLFFMKEPSIVILPKNMREKAEAGITWSNLSLLGLPYIEPYTRSGSGLLTNNFLKTQGLQFYGNLMADNMGLKLKLVAQNMGWFISRSVGFLNHLDILSEVTVIPVPAPGFSRRLYLVSSEDISLKLYLCVFNILIETMQEHVLPQVKSLFPWIAQEITLADKQDNL